MGREYLCVFGSLIIATHPHLQTTQTNVQCGLTNSLLELFNKSQADALRARDIAFTFDDSGDYQDLDMETMNTDLPSWVTYTSMADRIAAMTAPLSMPGELELIGWVKAS